MFYDVRGHGLITGMGEIQPSHSKIVNKPTKNLEDWKDSVLLFAHFSIKI